MELADGTKDVVDPEVRAYVSSLVTAVSLFILLIELNTDALLSLEEAGLTRMDDMYLEMMHWHVCEILRGG